MPPRDPMNQIDADTLRQSQQDLLDESHDYFATFFEWEQQAQEEFVNFTQGEE